MVKLSGIWQQNSGDDDRVNRFLDMLHYRLDDDENRKALLEFINREDKDKLINILLLMFDICLLKDESEEIRFEDFSKRQKELVTEGLVDEYFYRMFMRTLDDMY